MRSKSRRPRRSPKYVGGFSLIEALVAITIFSFGILGLIGLESLALKSAGDAQFRAEAAYLANQIISQIWTDRSNITSYKYNDTVAANCTFSGSAGNTATTNWMTDVSNALPSALGSVSVGTGNTVTVRICWNMPNSGQHVHTTVAQIN
jgi:type IV pilus assembly protein PilV